MLTSECVRSSPLLTPPLEGSPHPTVLPAAPSAHRLLAGQEGLGRQCHPMACGGPACCSGLGGLATGFPQGASAWLLPGVGTHAASLAVPGSAARIPGHVCSVHESQGHGLPSTTKAAVWLGLCGWPQDRDVPREAQHSPPETLNLGADQLASGSGEGGVGGFKYLPMRQR